MSQETNAQQNLDEMLQLKAEKERPGSAMPDCFVYEGRLLDTSTVIAGLCKLYKRDVAQSGGAK